MGCNRHHCQCNCLASCVTVYASLQIELPISKAAPYSCLSLIVPMHSRPPCHWTPRHLACNITVRVANPLAPQQLRLLGVAGLQGPAVEQHASRPPAHQLITVVEETNCSDSDAFAHVCVCCVWACGEQMNGAACHTMHSSAPCAMTADQCARVGVVSCGHAAAAWGWHVVVIWLVEVGWRLLQATRWQRRCSPPVAAACRAVGAASRKTLQQQANNLFTATMIAGLQLRATKVNFSFYCDPAGPGRQLAT